MSIRCRDATRLAYLLGHHTGIPDLRCEYRGAGSDPIYSGWQLTWGDGPTQDEMRMLVAHLAEQVPGVDTAALRYRRGSTDLAEAVALLRYLDDHPALVTDISMVIARTAFDTTSYPERSDERWLSRARALLSVGGRSALTWRALRGWSFVLAWLDGITVAAEDPTVAKLDQARARRGPLQ
jgi:hypothetical protein